ncbi:MAG: hypothetical protein IMW99_04240 [Firmicutes bacterium]|nr:hypothetical protein [Bacillota bacterium]
MRQVRKGFVPEDPAESEGLQSSTGLLISLLMRHPEIASIRFSRQNQALKFTFVVKAVLSRADWEAFVQRLRDSVEAFHSLNGFQDVPLAVRRSPYRDLTLIEIMRDVATLSQEEIALLTRITAETFAGKLVMEKDADAREPEEEEAAYQDELIQSLLDDLKVSDGGRDLIGYREAGRVFVFNKGVGNARRNTW